MKYVLVHERENYMCCFNVVKIQSLDFSNKELLKNPKNLRQFLKPSFSKSP